MKKISSWGNVKSVKYKNYLNFYSQKSNFNENFTNSIVFGNGRSYGDVCFGLDSIILSKDLNRVIKFDEKTGSFTCEPGLLLNDLFKYIVPKGWFLPVVPGTQYISIGGAVANDIHGKNHHRMGSFGNHIKEIKIKKTNNETIVCSENLNEDLFRATIGGLGLTGIIIEVTIQLIKINNSFISVSTLPFYSFKEYLELNSKLEKDYDYTVAWMDVDIRKKQINGIFHSGNHSEKNERLVYDQKKLKLFPFNLPFSLINNFTIFFLNKFYFLLNKQKKDTLMKLNNFFFPLDILYDWNKAYGKSGFYQYQFILPLDRIEESVGEILNIIFDSKIKPALTVVKTFGDIPSKGYLSFSREGVSFAIDFPNKGRKLNLLFNKLDNIIFQYNGALYPAKDIRMSREMFSFSFPLIKTFLKYKDPKMTSSFFERVKP